MNDLRNCRIIVDGSSDINLPFPSPFELAAQDQFKIDVVARDKITMRGGVWQSSVRAHDTSVTDTSTPIAYRSENHIAVPVDSLSDIFKVDSFSSGRSDTFTVRGSRRIWARLDQRDTEPGVIRIVATAVSDEPADTLNVQNALIATIGFNAVSSRIESVLQHHQGSIYSEMGRRIIDTTRVLNPTGPAADTDNWRSNNGENLLITRTRVHFDSATVTVRTREELYDRDGKLLSVSVET